MATIKDSYYFPIYCPNAELNVNGEQNFYATGADIVDTLADADVYVKKSGDDMTGRLNFVKADTGQGQLRINLNSGSNDFTTSIVACNSGTLRIRTTTDDTGSVSSNWQTHVQCMVEDHTINGVDFDRKTILNCVQTPSQDDHGANRFYVDSEVATTKEELEEQIEILNARIIELEEEINSIAAAVVRGKWENNSSDAVPGEAQYVMLDSSDNNTDNFSEAVKVLIAEHDIDGGDHSFADVTEDEYLQILNEENEAYGLYTVQVVNGRDAPVKYYEFEVTFDQSYNGEGQDEPIADGPARVKLFTPPVMSDEAFIVRSGDTMEGTLNCGKENDYKGRLTVKSNKGTGPNNSVFDVKAVDHVTGGEALYYGKITENNHIITKQYYEANFQHGPQGEKGDTPTFTVGDVITGLPETLAEVEDVGTDGDIVLNFTIPEGKQGIQGERGVEVIKWNQTTPPPDGNRGDLLITSNNRFYLYY